MSKQPPDTHETPGSSPSELASGRSGPTPPPGFPVDGLPPGQRPRPWPSPIAVLAALAIGLVGAIVLGDLVLPRGSDAALAEEARADDGEPVAAPSQRPSSDAAAAEDAADAGADADAEKGKQAVKTVQVHVFDKQGELVGPVPSPVVEKTDKQWREQLTDEQFRITRRDGTERPFCGTLLDNKKKGVYACVCCGLPLFSSDSKFKSGTGWPSFFQPIAKGNVGEHVDRSYGMVRTEILCARCDAHLGHVFEDGPRPTGLRFCVNSESLTFTESEDLAELADPAAKQATGGEGGQPAVARPADEG